MLIGKFTLVLFGILLLIVPISYAISASCGSSNVCSGGSCTCKVVDCDLGYLDIYTSQTDIKPIQEFEIQSGQGNYTLPLAVMPKSNSVYFLKLTCLSTGQNYPATPTRNPFSISVSGEGACSDGTLLGGCSKKRPDRCVNGDLIKDCGFCGCISGASCDEFSGSCSFEGGESGGYCGDKKCDSDESGSSCPKDCGDGGIDIEEQKRGKINCVLILLGGLVVLLILFAFRRKLKKGGRKSYETFAPLSSSGSLGATSLVSKEDEHKRKLSEALKKAAENIRKQHGKGEEGYKYPYGKGREGRRNFEEEKKFI